MQDRASPSDAQASFLPLKARLNDREKASFLEAREKTRDLDDAILRDTREGFSVANTRRIETEWDEAERADALARCGQCEGCAADRDCDRPIAGFEMADPAPDLGETEFRSKLYRGLRAAELRGKAAEARRLARIAGSLESQAIACGSTFVMQVTDDRGTFAVDDNGDYVLDESKAPLKKKQRRVRRVEDREKSRERFYTGRAVGQVERFARVRGCGKLTIAITCRLDGSARNMVARCGVVRLCKACADRRAVQRQRGVAAGRLRALERGKKYGLWIKNRAGGRFTEKHMVVTVPHFAMGDVREGSPLADALRKKIGARNTIFARVEALYLAWPRFASRVRRYLKKVLVRGMHEDERYRGPKGDAKLMVLYRLTEWTLGRDLGGHPHFHIYCYSPRLPYELIRQWWAEALHEAGVPLAFRKDAKKVDVIVDVRHLQSVDHAMLDELVKKGERAAIEKLGTLRDKTKWTGSAADKILDYADATMVKTFDELRDAGRDAEAADLFWALEGRRLAQGSLGFIVPPLPAGCPCCGQREDAWGRSIFTVALVDPTRPHRYESERGPPPS